MYADIHQATVYLARQPHLVDDPQTAKSVAVMFDLQEYQVQEIIETVKEAWSTEAAG